MELLKNFFRLIYLPLLILLIAYTIMIKIAESLSWLETFHLIAFYLPAISMITDISAHIELLTSMQRGGIVNLKARIYDFVHWQMLIGINIAAWMIGGSTIWWFILKLTLLAIIAWEIGVGIKRKLALTIKERTAGIYAAIIALLLGLASGYFRYTDDSLFGRGWGFESGTAILATLIVLRWMWLDIKTISSGQAKAYPRAFFLKGMLGNLMVLIFWLHIMLLEEGIASGLWWLRNLGLSFNILVGNLIFFPYWITYELYRKKQE